MTPMVMASIFKTLIGEKQLGGMAPPPMMGRSNGVGGNADILAQLAQQNNFGQGGMIGGLPQAMQNLPETAGTPKINSKDKAPSSVIEENPEQSGFGKFFGNLDSTLSSPSKTLGIGALGQINPYVGLAALLASGFMNQQNQ